MISPNLQYEHAAWRHGHTVVAGVDEVGRGAWAGPIVAASVQLPHASVCYGQITDNQQVIQLPKLLRDSKKLSSRQRQKLDEEIRSVAVQVTIGVVEVEDINQMGIGQANFLAMSRALSLYNPPVDFMLIDGYQHPDYDALKQQSLVKGDSLVASIAAASIIAKVFRDQLMVQLEQDYPKYGFDQHKGYGTVAHQQAIKLHGLSPIHRRNFNLKFLTLLLKVSGTLF